jgi:CheY-like chemotaxis protein
MLDNPSFQGVYRKLKVISFTFSVFPAGRIKEGGSRGDRQTGTVDADTREEIMGEVKPSERSDRKRKVLLIDDEENFCFFIKLNLEKTGRFDVLTTTSGAEGIILAAEEQPDLILLDIVMPELDGGQVAEQLLENQGTKDIPVLFITAIASRQGIQSHEGRIGGRHFIAKPAMFEEIMEKIDRILEFKK